MYIRISLIWETHEMKEYIKKNPKVFILIYLFYMIILAFLVGSGNSYLIVAIVAPLSILIGIYVWEWQEGVKNEGVKKQVYNKNYNEKAEKIFSFYTKYEKSIQNLYRFFSELNIVIQPKDVRVISKYKEISFFLEKMEAEIELLRDLEVDLYNEAVLFYYLISNQKQIDNDEALRVNVYKEATDLMNTLCNYIYVYKEIEKLVENFKHSEKSQEFREEALISDYYDLKPIINSFNFGNTLNPNEIIYEAPRKKFLELTKAL